MCLLGKPILLFLAGIVAVVKPEGDSMLVIGGSFHPRQIEMYHPESRAQTVLDVELLGNGRMYHVSAQLNDTHVLIAGGRDPRTRQRLSSASILNVAAQTIAAIAETGEQRSGAAGAVLDGNVYVCGGLEGRDDRRCATNKCEKWNGFGWSYVAALRQDRGIFAMATLGKYIYAMGGEINAGPCAESDAYTVLNTVERYDADKDQWDKMKPMTNRRYAHAAAAFMGKIWVCGGHFDANYETERNSGCETYDPVADVWALASNTMASRAGLALINMNDVLYAVGGAAIPLSDKWFTYDYTPFTLEELNPGNLSWTRHPEFLKTRAYGASLNSVKPHVAPYKAHEFHAAAVVSGGSVLFPSLAALLAALPFLLL